MVVAPGALTQLRQFADGVDRAAPGVLTGLYGVGSVALGDFRRPLSNIDAVAVADQPWDDSALQAVRRAARRLHRPGQPARLACLTWADLRRDPAEVEAAGFVGRAAVPGADLVNPLTWAVLRTAGVCVRGSEYPELGLGDVRGWAEARLAGWWSPWLERVRPGPLILRRNIAEGVLEVARLSQIVSSGRVVSKLEAGEAVQGTGPPNRQRVLKDAAGYRRGLRMSMYWGPYERRRHALAYIRSAVEAAKAAPGTLEP
ncbi:MAG: hypothetical protein ACYCUG_16855 [Acidimicrobiales bacterium]